MTSKGSKKLKKEPDANQVAILLTHRKQFINYLFNFITNKKLSKFFNKKPSETDSESSQTKVTAEQIKNKLPELKTETKLVKNESIETKMFNCLKKYFNYDCFKSETQKNAVLEIAKRKNDVYGKIFIK